MTGKVRELTRPSIYFDRVSSLVEERPVSCRTDYEGVSFVYRVDRVKKLTWARPRQVLRIIQAPVHWKIGRNKGFLVPNQGPDNLKSFLPRHVVPYLAQFHPSTALHQDVLCSNGNVCRGAPAIYPEGRDTKDISNLQRNFMSAIIRCNESRSQYIVHGGGFAGCRKVRPSSIRIREFGD